QFSRYLLIGGDVVGWGLEGYVARFVHDVDAGVAEDGVVHRRLESLVEEERIGYVVVVAEPYQVVSSGRGGIIVASGRGVYVEELHALGVVERVELVEGGGFSLAV